MTDIGLLTPTQDERVMSALAHVSALIPMMGVIAPIVIWATQKDKSKYVAFQSLQALAYQLSMIVASFVGWGCYMLSFFGTFLPIIFTSSENSESIPPAFFVTFFFPFFIIAIIMVGGFGLIAYGIFGAVMAFQGKPFRYLVIGRRVEHFMQPNQVEKPPSPL